MSIHIERTLIPEAGTSYSVHATGESLCEVLELPVEPGEGLLIVTLRSATGALLEPARDVNVQLLDPDGKAHTTWRPGRSEQAEVAVIHDPAPGIWTLAVEAGPNCDLALDAAAVVPGRLARFMRVLGRVGCAICKTVPRAVVVAILIALAKAAAAGTVVGVVLAQLDRLLEALRKILEMTRDGFASVLDWLKDRIFDPVDRVMEGLCQRAGICP